MFKNKSLLVYLFASISFYQAAYAQIVIDYSYAKLETSTCNVFASATTYKGYEHQTTLGSPNFTTANYTVNLVCSNYNTDYVKSTQYQIKFNFKNGYKYSISAYGKSGLSTNPADIGFAFSENGNTANTSTNCTGGAQLLSKSDRGQFAEAAFGTGFGWADNVVNNYTMTKNYGYLIVAALPNDVMPTPVTINLQQIKNHRNGTNCFLCYISCFCSHSLWH